jgi:hypothetical protein
MLSSVRTFCHDQRGSLFTTEWVFIATILVLGAFTYLMAQRHVLVSEWDRAALSAKR